MAIHRNIYILYTVYGYFVFGHIRRLIPTCWLELLWFGNVFFLSPLSSEPVHEELYDPLSGIIDLNFM